MKYSHRSRRHKSCHYDSDFHADLGRRLRHSRCSLGWSIEHAAKYFQVTERTWHNWESGVHRIPFAVYKLCRVLARFELPDPGWAGWSFQGGSLITPEGRQIGPRDASWWSLMVRNAQAFGRAYEQAARLRVLLAQATAGAGRSPHEGDASAAGAGLVPSKTSRPNGENRNSQNDVIMKSWPTRSDSQTPSTPQPGQKPTTSESPLTPSYALPWTPTCAVQLRYQRPSLGPHCLSSQIHPKQVRSSQDQRPSPSSPASSPEPKRSACTTSETASSGAANGASARPAAADAAQLASASGGVQ